MPSLTNASAVTDMYGQRVLYGYDGLHRLTSRQYTVGRTSLTLDANGNPLTLKDRNGRVTSIEYDVLDRPRTVRDPLNRLNQ